jgi:hypothetical protein
MGKLGRPLPLAKRPKKNFVPHDGHSPPDDIFVTPLPAGGSLPT